MLTESPAGLHSIFMDLATRSFFPRRTVPDRSWRQAGPEACVAVIGTPSRGRGRLRLLRGISSTRGDGSARVYPCPRDNVMMTFPQAEGSERDVLMNPRTGRMTGLVLLGSILPGCGGDDPPGAAGPGAAGEGRPGRSSSTARAPSSGSARPPRRRSQQVNPDVKVVVDNHGTGGGFSRYLQGEVDIVDASRPAKPDEEAKAKAQGIDWTRFLVGYDGITVVVNPKNDFVKSLTVEQLKAIWEPGQQGQDLEGPRPVLARPEDRPVQPRQRLGDLRVLHRGDRRQGQEPARGRAGRAPTTTPWSTASPATRRPRLLRLRLLRRQQGASSGRSPSRTVPTPSRSCPSPETILDKSYAPLSRPLYHLREELGAATARGRRSS